MDGTSQVLINLSEEEEFEALQDVIVECHGQLERWRERTWSFPDFSADAVVAVLSLEHACQVRRAYLLGRQRQEELPF